jgi:FKBP-type peptidyl-prolyl cis-trans isomerase
MRKPLITFGSSLIIAIMSFATAFAQQTPGSGAPQTPASTSKKTTAARRATAPARQSNPVSLTTQQDKISYALGMNMAKNLQRESVKIAPEVLSRGLNDVLSGKKTLLTEDELNTTLTALQKDIQTKQQEKAQQLGAVNKEQGETFLAANKAKEGVVALPSGLQYKILNAGTGPKPSSTDSVSCNYRGTLINGTEFDSSYKRGQPATFPLNAVIKGWTEALQLMPVGSKWELFIPPDLAYGGRGASPDVGPNATLIFDVELLSIQGK